MFKFFAHILLIYLPGYFYNFKDNPTSINKIFKIYLPIELGRHMSTT